MIERITALLLAAGLALSAGCGRDSVNFSQEPGFAEYFAAHPPATAPAEPTDQELLRRYRPRFMLPPGHPGAIDFYTDYVPEGRLTNGEGRRIPGPLNRAALNAHKCDPRAVFEHEWSGRPGSATVYGGVDREPVTFETSSGPVTVPFTFLTYHVVFRLSGLPAGLLPWQEQLVARMADPVDWHQVDHFTATTLVLDREQRPVALILQQHHHLHTYLLGRDVPLPADGRVVVDVAIRSNELYPHMPGRQTRRTIATPGAVSLRYLISGDRRPIIGAEDITEGVMPLEYRLQFLPPDDAFYTFQGFLDARRSIPGRSGPPGAGFNVSPQLKPRARQMLAFYWREGNAGDLERLDAAQAKDQPLVEFARVQSAVFYQDWRALSSSSGSRASGASRRSRRGWRDRRWWPGR